MTNEADPTAGDSAFGNQRVRRIRVLHLDDEPGLTKLSKLTLEKLRHLHNGEVCVFEVDESNDCHDALAKLDRYSYDVVLSNVIMASLDGGEFAHEARARGCTVPIGFVTAIIEKKSDEAEFIDGVGFLAKPATINGLVRFIFKLIERGMPKT